MIGSPNGVGQASKSMMKSGHGRLKVGLGSWEVGVGWEFLSTRGFWELVPAHTESLRMRSLAL